MSDKRKEREERKGPPLDVTPEATNPDLCDWMERLFDGEFPMKLVAVEIHGKSGVLERGFEHDHKDFKPNQPKPQKQEFVELSNRFLAAAQRDCDMRRRPQNYVVEAYNNLKSADPYSRFPLPLFPKSTYLSALNKGKNGEHGHNGIDEDEDGSDPFARDKLLRRLDRMATEHRAVFELMLISIGQSLQLTSTTNAELREHVDTLMKRWVDATESAEKAKSGEADRALARAKQEFWLKQMSEGFSYAKMLIPVGLKRIAGKDVLPGTANEEMVVLNEFVKGCTDEQLEAMFGRWSEPDPQGNVRQVKPGIFTERQSYIIEFVRLGKLDPKKILNLLPGSEDEVKQEQLAALVQIGIKQTQLEPLQLFFFALMERKAKGQA